MAEPASSTDQLQSYIESFISAHEDINDQSIEKLTSFINQQNIGTYSSQQIKNRVRETLDRERRIHKRHEEIAELFTQDHMVRRIRFGSAFCPNCQMFKNFDKECPYCQFLEVTY